MNDNIHEKTGPMLLLAGPGTGKTYRLGKRIKYLTEEKGVSPEEITVITFTAAAAKNMRERISDEDKPELYIEPSQQPKSIRTMHSLGYLILRDDDSKLDFECHNVITDSNLLKILYGDAAQIAGYKRKQGEMAMRCRQYGNCNLSEDVKCKICQKYQQLLRACSAIDQDDQILLACEVLKDNPELLLKYQLQCKHLLIDEYQDINAAQFELIKLLSQKHQEGLFVVGDDDQSIYSWRGGSPEFIRKFDKDFGDNANIVPLNVSWRCHKHILEGATCVVSGFDNTRFEKGPFTYKVPDGSKIQIHNVASDEREAEIIKAIIMEALPSRDVLILVRTKNYAKALRKVLVESRIPFSASTTAPGEGLPVMATLAKWLSNPAESLLFRLCLEEFLNNNSSVPSKKAYKPVNKEKRKKIFQNISKLWEPLIEKQKDSLWDSLMSNATYDPILMQALETFEEIIKLNQGKNTALFASHVFESLGIWKNPSDLLKEFNAWVRFYEQFLPQSQGENVRIMSMQGAKGLEARVVCVLGVEEGSLPLNSTDPSKLAEDARLFYVSATRAKDELHLFHARKRSGKVVQRNIYAAGGKPDMRPSRFLEQIDKTHKENKYHQAKK
ncbi:MAG: ATP-dependent helicase [Planctomycetes bacterium]|nr:ATP-dependent helicase [Planctomycetota bacterium]